MSASGPSGPLGNILFWKIDKKSMQNYSTCKEYNYIIIMIDNQTSMAFESLKKMRP